MAGRFLLRRSELAREQAQCTVETSAEALTTLVALVTSLADRMDAMPSRSLEADRDRRERVQVLRRAAEAGTRSLATRDRSRSGADGQQALG